MKKIYERLVDSDIIEVDLQTDHKPRVMALEEIMYSSFAMLEKTFDEKQRDLFSDCLINMESYMSAISKEAFNKGYLVGAKMTAEILIDAEKQVNK